MQPSFGRQFLCHNQGPYYAREIVHDGEPLFVDARLADLWNAESLIARGWTSPALISPDAPPTVVS